MLVSLLNKNIVLYISIYILNNKLFYSCFIFILKCVFVQYLFYFLLHSYVTETKLSSSGQNLSEFELFSCVENKKEC